MRSIRPYCKSHGVVARFPQASQSRLAATAAYSETPYVCAKAVPERGPESSAIDFAVKNVDCLQDQPLRVIAR